VRNSFARANPLIGLSAEEYKDFACALVSYVAVHATVDQTTYFLSLCRDYSRDIAGKVALAARVRLQLAPVLAKGERCGAAKIVVRGDYRKSLSH
jgi:hypothetical protein